MFKKTIIFILMILLFALNTYANSCTIKITAVMPNIVVMADEDSGEQQEDEELMYEEYQDDQVTFAQESVRDGKAVIIKSIVKK